MLFAPEVYKFGMLDWSKFDGIVEVGYSHAMKKIELLGEDAIDEHRYPTD
jgi:hypothetical protein